VRALASSPEFAPPEARGQEDQFGPAVPAPDDADVYTQLAAYLATLCR
jgi:hypothetical protein